MPRVMTEEMWRAHQALYGRERSLPARGDNIDLLGDVPTAMAKLRAEEGAAKPALLHRLPRVISLTLPMPPSVNVRMANHVLTREHRAFRVMVAGIVGTRHKPLEGPVSAEIIAYPANRQRDSDNLVKPLFDALQHVGIFASGRDNQVREFNVRMVDGTKRDEVVVLLTERQ